MTKEDALFFLGRFRTEGINEKLYDALGVAIEALNAQTDKRTETHACDLISRQAAIDAAKRVMVIRDKRSVSVCDAIKALPPAQQWIPCKERLPEAYTDVLVWFEYFRYGNYNRLYQMYGIGSYSAEYDSWMINYETGWRKLRVLAWMPLPEPWEGDKE